MKDVKTGGRGEIKVKAVEEVGVGGAMRWGGAYKRR